MPKNISFGIVYVCAVIWVKRYMFAVQGKPLLNYLPSSGSNQTRVEKTLSATTEPIDCRLTAVGRYIVTAGED